MEWIPALSTSALLGAAVWFGRNLIFTRLTKSVEHEFNGRLETLKAQLRDSEERLKAELRNRESEIAALRGGALSALASRQAALDKRRLEAVDQLWTSVSALAPGRAIAASMSLIKFDAAAEAAERDPKYRRFFETIGAGFNPQSMDLSGASKAQPFVTPMVWAIFSAMRAVTMHGVMRWLVLKGGLGKTDYTDHEAINKLIKAALPHYSDYIDQHGASVYSYALEALDSRLLEEVRAMLNGADTNAEHIAQAAEILRQSGLVVNEASGVPTVG